MIRPKNKINRCEPHMLRIADITIVYTSCMCVYAVT